MAAYIALIRKEPDSCYGVDFPDFPGCITAGDSLDEAVALAADALGTHIRGMGRDGLPIPSGSALESILADPENAGAVPFVVVPNLVAKGRSVRANITVEEALLAEIDAFAEEHNLSRSAFLAAAARRAMVAG